MVTWIYMNFYGLWEEAHAVHAVYQFNTNSICYLCIFFYLNIYIFNVIFFLNKLINVTARPIKYSFLLLSRTIIVVRFSSSSSSRITFVGVVFSASAVIDDIRTTVFIGGTNTRTVPAPPARPSAAAVCLSRLSSPGACWSLRAARSEHGGGWNWSSNSAADPVVRRFIIIIDIIINSARRAGG